MNRHVYKDSVQLDRTVRKDHVPSITVKKRDKNNMAQNRTNPEIALLIDDKRSSIASTVRIRKNGPARINRSAKHEVSKGSQASIMNWVPSSNP